MVTLLIAFNSLELLTWILLRAQHSHRLEAHAKATPRSVSLVIDRARVFVGEDAEAAVALREIHLALAATLLRCFAAFLTFGGASLRHASASASARVAPEETVMMGERTYREGSKGAAMGRGYGECARFDKLVRISHSRSSRQATRFPNGLASTRLP